MNCHQVLLQTQRKSSTTRCTCWFFWLQDTSATTYLIDNIPECLPVRDSIHKLLEYVRQRRLHIDTTSNASMHACTHTLQPFFRLAGLSWNSTGPTPTLGMRLSYNFVNMQVFTSLQTTMPVPQHSVFHRSDTLPAADQQRQSTESTIYYNTLRT